MIFETPQLVFSPEQAKDDDFIRQRLAEYSPFPEFQWRWRKRSIDARKNPVKIIGSFSIWPAEEMIEEPLAYQPQPLGDKTLHIIGAGPAGLFAALRCLELGIKPIVLERGKPVRERRRDLAAINKYGEVNPESNYCFGEGGAGTYSDGKLYTRSKKRGDVHKVLALFHHFGAPRDILVDAHPHIGTNKLPKIIEAMRHAIEEGGGEVLFEKKVTDFKVVEGSIRQIEINGTEHIECQNVLLATGHSSRDIFHLFHRRQWALQAKSFALGVRVEHPQALIDKIQYHGRTNDEFLPPASYALVTQVDGKGVFSFCMCPGGIIAPCATEPGQVVTNGWSPSKRNNPYSNSGIVVTIDPKDCGDEQDPLVSLRFQMEVERKCWEAAGRTQQVPAQRMIDFCEGRLSVDFPKTSYQPGLASADLNQILPSIVATRLRQAFRDFGKKMKGYYTNEAVLHAPESRTSSPVQIPRDSETGRHPDLSNLFPCAEGAGFAGGIVSAAVDGINQVDRLFYKANQGD